MMQTTFAAAAAVTDCDAAAAALPATGRGDAPAPDAFAALLESMSAPPAMQPLAAEVPPVEPAGTQQEPEPDFSWLAALPEPASPLIAAPLLALQHGRSPVATQAAITRTQLAGGGVTGAPGHAGHDGRDAASAGDVAVPAAPEFSVAFAAPGPFDRGGEPTAPGQLACAATASAVLTAGTRAVTAKADVASPVHGGQEMDSGAVEAPAGPLITATAVEPLSTAPGPLPPSAPAVTAHAGALPAVALATAPASPASAAVHQAALPSQPLEAAFAGDLAAEVRLMVGVGLQRAELHLHPADLGPIHIRLSVNSQTADISFAAAHSATREGIAQALPALREMLSGQGLSLGQAGVSSQHPGQPSADGRQLPEYASHRLAVSDVGAAPSTAAATLEGSFGHGRGMLDLYA